MSYIPKRKPVRRAHPWRLGLTAIAAVGVIGAAAWWYFGASRKPKPKDLSALVAEPSPKPGTAQAQPAAKPLAKPAASAANQPKPATQPAPAVASNGPQPQNALRPVPEPGPTTSAPSSPTTQPAAALATPAPPNTPLASARGQIERGQWLAARNDLNTLLKSGRLSPADTREVCDLLKRVADETVFSKRPIADDPLVAPYTVVSGDVLINIGRKFDVPAEVIMDINGIRDPRTIRVDQKLKVPRGPFKVRIDKSDFRLDVYLDDVYVRSYPVGLGKEGGTPEGVWRVKERLENPTYYPPATAGEKRIIAPDDPANPLGEHWIGLEGIEGEAVGHEGYGIHGTVEPDSIGHAVSLGCVRMHNEDVAVLFRMLQPGRSTVTILP